MNDTIDFTLSWKPSKDKATVTAKCDGDTVHIDSIDPKSASARTKYAKALGSLGCDVEQAESDLLEIAEGFSPGASDAKQSQTVGAEVDLSDIQRPERIMLDGISGLTVPVFYDGGDRVVRSWRCYIRVGEDRKAVEIAGRMQIGDKRFFVNPTPYEPDVNSRTCWSEQGRKDWLAGVSKVDPADLFKSLVESIDHHVEFEAEHRKGILAAVACWVVLTYNYHVWPAVPYLFLNGPAGSGKSTTFDVLRRLCFRVFKTDMPSPPTIFRTLHEMGGTLLYDEAERLKQTKSEDIGKINAMLLAGYRCGGSADLMEKVGDNFKRVSFNVYGPKAIANINGVPPALASRSIEITMQRAEVGSEKPNRQINMYEWQPIIDALHVLAVDHGDAWLSMAIQNSQVVGLNGRDNELWKPLVAIARWFESKGVEGLTDILVDYANASADESRDQSTSDIDVTLLEILAAELKLGRWVTAKDILEKARDEDQTTYRGWSPKGVANRLRAFGLRPVKSGSARTYRDRNKLADIGERHGLDFGLSDHP